MRLKKLCNSSVLLVLLLVPLSLVAGTVQLPKTGQTINYAARDDGALIKGVAWPNPRFNDNGDQTITDNLTGLMWTKDADRPAGVKTWQAAVDYIAAANIANGGVGTYGHNDWRLPNIKELKSLVDISQSYYALPAGHPFTDIQPNYYWSSSSYALNGASAWYVSMTDGSVGIDDKTSTCSVWAVRGGQSGTLGVVGVSPANNIFGPVFTNATSAAQPFTISNTGVGNLAISGIATSGTDSTLFTINAGDGTGGTCGSLTPNILSGDDCTVSVTFTPHAAIGNRSTDLRIISNDPDARIKNISLSGTGVAQYYTIGTAVVGGNGAITCNSPVAKGGVATCTITPNTDYRLVNLTDNDVNRMGYVSANKYTITNVTADHTVKGTFWEKVPPIVYNFIVSPLTNSLTIPVLALNAYDNVGVTGYLITESATPPAINAAWSAVAPASYTTTAAGVRTLYAWAKDGAANVSLAKTATCTVDIYRPFVTAFTLPVVVNKLTVPVTAFTVMEDVAMGAYMITESAIAPAAGDVNWKMTKPTYYTFDISTTDGIKDLYAWAKDKAGNVSAYKKVQVKIDRNVPQITAFSVPPLVNTLTVPVTTLTSDDLSGSYLITSTATPPAANLSTWSVTKPTRFVSATAGIKTLYAWVKDPAGNVSAAATAVVNIDNAKPVVSAFTVAPFVNTLVIPVTAFTATDSTGVTGYLITGTATVPALAAAWSATAPVSFTVATAGAKALYAWTRDQAGNVSLAKIASSTVDITKPVVTAFTLPASVTTLTVPVTSFTVTDNVAMGAYQITESSSAPAVGDINWKSAKPTSYVFGGGTANGAKTLYAWAKDKCGNVSLARSAPVNLNR
jgi:hypothetical protein